MNRFQSILKRAIDLTKMPMMKILPGQLAFFMVLSIIPIFTLIGNIASIFSISVDSTMSFLGTILPEAVTDVLFPFMRGHGFDINVFAFMLSGFMVASNGPHSIILASNMLYGIEDKNDFLRRMKAFFMTIILVILFFFVLIVLGLGNMIVNYIVNLKVLSFFSKEFYYLFAYLKWPIAFFVIFLGIKIIYIMAPSKKIKPSYVNRGVLFTTIGFLLATAIYSYYVSNFAHYDIFYGSLSNIIILMLWVYLLAYIMTLGIGINAATYEKLENIDIHKSEEKKDTKK